MRRPILWLFLLVSFHLSAQQTTDYTPLKSSGEMPRSFITSSSQKYSDAIQKNISEADSRRTRRHKNDFLLENAFAIRNLVLNGKVLFNDSVSRYLNRVMDKLTASDPTLHKEVEVYAIKSPYVNAFTTNDGLIFVYMGLVARLDNEAQLAFVLAHELTHYKKKHIIKGYLEDVEVDSRKGMYRNTTDDDRLLAKSQYSRANESEADREGLELMLKAGYSPASLAGVFDLMAYADAQVFNEPFDYSLFTANQFTFPKAYMPDSIRPVLPDTVENKYSTHPGVNVRRADILARAKDRNTNGATYLVSRKSFENVKRMCRYELCDIYLRSENYRQCIYLSSILLKNDPNSKYLQKCILASLYGLEKHASYAHWNNDDLDGADEESDIENNTTAPIKQGYVHQVDYLVNHLDGFELSAVGLKYGWALKAKYPDDQYIQKMTADMGLDLCGTSRDLGILADTLGALQKKYPDAKRFGDTFEITKHDNTAAQTRIDVFASGDVNRNIAKDTMAPGQAYAYLNNALGVESHNWHFTRLMNDNMQHAATTDRVILKANSLKLPEGNDIKKVVFVNPFCTKYNLKKKRYVRYVASESAQRKFNRLIVQDANKAGLQSVLIDKNMLGVKSTDTFNDIASLENFVDAKYNFGNIPMNALDDDELNALSKKYGTDYFCWTGVISVREKSPVTPLVMLISTIYFPSLPFTIYKAVKPYYSTYYYCALYNIRTKQRVHVMLERYKYNDRPDVLNVTMYDLFNRYHKSK
jgi:Zn-dependent protease with chaperone function